MVWSSLLMVNVAALTIFGSFSTLKTRIGHNIGLQAPISFRSARPLSSVCHTARVGWCRA